mmetsp:Transcript_5638/g.14382  ORF Transcript_5638/g.14382 Transcript_5638/m.14382 type:complete len:219 (+) Transcript_5638:494-1150(+)
MPPFDASRRCRMIPLPPARYAKFGGGAGVMDTSLEENRYAERCASTSPPRAFKSSTTSRALPAADMPTTSGRVEIASLSLSRGTSTTLMKNVSPVMSRPIASTRPPSPSVVRRRTPGLRYRSAPGSMSSDSPGCSLSCATCESPPMTSIPNLRMVSALGVNGELVRTPISLGGSRLRASSFPFLCSYCSFVSFLSVRHDSTRLTAVVSAVPEAAMMAT